MALLEKDPAMCQFIQQQFMGKYEYLTWSVIMFISSWVFCHVMCTIAKNVVAIIMLNANNYDSVYGAVIMTKVILQW